MPTYFHLMHLFENVFSIEQQTKQIILNNVSRRFFFIHVHLDTASFYHYTGHAEAIFWSVVVFILLLDCLRDTAQFFLSL